MTQQIINDISVTDIADEGKAVGRIDNKIIFLDKAVPGDVVDVLITKKKKSYLEGKVISIKTFSQLRTEPFCEHFGTCGGCKWQHLDYDAQLQFKQKQVDDALKRIGRVNGFEMLPILGSENKKYYRNKLEYTFSNKRWLTKEEFQNGNGMGTPALGFHIPGLFDKVLDIKNCYLQPAPSNAIRLEVKDYAVKNNLTFFDLKSQQGFLRNMIIRNTTLDEWMAIMIFHHDDPEKRNGLLNHLSEKFPAITSLMYVINPKRNDSIYDLEVHLFKGTPFITEQMEELKFRIGPKSFFQTNSRQAYELYKVARNFAALTGNETVYDLYTGTGTIANFIAKNSKKVIGVDSVSESIEDAKTNSAVNNIQNTVFYPGDLKNVLTNDFMEQNGKPDVIITDPPRAGMHEDVTKRILYSGADRIVYISCNPSTQARDVNILSEKYELIKSQPVDMFPHTHHVENVVLLKLKS
ncbi:MAG TPA: 23S rRNA (uracil(1939)-C(5))-methyltransferase RlmD [Bacteroidia bacterium]|nr:23S rRNA (uracil(1939)-C(5))-methyltransferase RlmD [Bacteroidia bacterium]